MLKRVRLVLCLAFFLLLIVFFSGTICSAQKIAITFDDLPLNGDLAPGTTRSGMVQDALAILKKRHVPPVYGFLNAKRIERSEDGAEALKLWATEEPLGNHTYSHMDLTQNSPEAFERDIAENEPVLELLNPPGNWQWFRYPYLHEGDTLEKRNAVREYLRIHGYKIAEVTLDWEDYLWNTAYARCAAKNDAKSIEWLRSSYLETASNYIDFYKATSKMLFARDINYVLLMHLGAYTSTILPSVLDLLKKKGFILVTLQEAESDSVYESDPAVPAGDGGTLLDLFVDAKHLKPLPVAEKPYKELQSACQ